MEPVTQGYLSKPAALAALVGAVALLAACQPNYESVELVQPTGVLDRDIATRIVELVEEDSPLEVRLIEPAEGMSPLDTLEAGIGDVTFASNVQAYREEISTIIPLYPRVLHIMVRAEETPDDIGAVLSGRRVYAGARGSRTRAIVRDLAEELDFVDSGMTLVDDWGPDVDVIFVYAPIDRASIMSETRLEVFRMFSLDEPDAIGLGGFIDRVTLLDPRLRPFVIPEGTYGDVLTPEPIVTVAVENLLVARADLDPSLVYDLFSEILRIRPALFGERPELFRPIDKSVASSNFAFSMHPGAVAYLNQDEPTFIERYSGVAEVLVTLLVGLISGGWALLRIYKIRRKNRIDRFYVDVMRIRDSVAADASEATRRDAVAELRALEDRAFEQLVDEQLAADESFRIFIELTNNTIDALRAPR